MIAIKKVVLLALVLTLAATGAIEIEEVSECPAPCPVIALVEEECTLYEATAYCYTGCKTATGTWPQEGRTVAVDPKVIPLGTELIIDGREGYIAEDTGGVIKGNKIDVYIHDKERCIQFGRREVKVRVKNGN